jgi:hypothetical protein
MKTLIQTLFNWIASRLCERWHLSLEYLALLHQLEVLKRSAKRSQFSPTDRGLWLILSSVWSQWPQALEIVQADTVRKWKRQGIWHHLRWRREHKRPGRPPIPAETRTLIREMNRDNRLWGTPRIHGELIKLGIKVSRTTVVKYMDRRPETPSPMWRTFWRIHAPDLVVFEFYAELSSRLRAASARVVRIIPTFCVWLWGSVSGWRYWSLRRYVMPAPPLTAADRVPVTRPPSGDELVRALGRSPPEYQSSSIDPSAYLYPPIQRERADVRQVSSARDGWGMPAQVIHTPKTVHTVQRADGTQQAAA